MRGRPSSVSRRDPSAPPPPSLTLLLSSLWVPDSDEKYKIASEETGKTGKTAALLRWTVTRGLCTADLHGHCSAHHRPGPGQHLRQRGEVAFGGESDLLVRGDGGEDTPPLPGDAACPRGQRGGEFARRFGIELESEAAAFGFAAHDAVGMLSDTQLRHLGSYLGRGCAKTRV